MSSLLISLGWFIFAVALVYWLVTDKSTDPAVSLQYIARTKQILMVSVGVLLAGYSLKYLGHLAGIGRDRCKKCGKRIDKGEMFCFDHRRDSIWQAQERHRVDAPQAKRRP
jgi:hypothetical protein